MGAPLPIALSILLLLSACSEAQAPDDIRNKFGRIAEAAPQTAVQLKGWVTDDANILSLTQESALASKLESLEKRTGHQFVVVTVPSLAGRDVAAFTRDLGNEWGLGRQQMSDGVILLLAPNERKVRIDVGYGLERVLTNALCQRILEEDVLPRFREGRLPEGIAGGADAIVARLG